MDKKIQLFLLPYAGGNSQSFKNIVPLIDERIEVVTIEYAGRMTRREEGYITEYNLFLQDVAKQIENVRKQNMPYAVLGYSLGSALLYDLLSKKFISGSPIHAFACAKGSLLKHTKSQKYIQYSEEDFLQEIIALGGIDDRIIQNERFLKIYMEPVKADYLIWSQYSFGQGIIPCDVTAIYSKEDSLSNDVKDWDKVVAGKTDYYEMGTSHFFINECWEEMADIVNRKLARYIED